MGVIWIFNKLTRILFIWISIKVKTIKLQVRISYKSSSFCKHISINWKLQSVAWRLQSDSKQPKKVYMRKNQQHFYILFKTKQKMFKMSCTAFTDTIIYKRSIVLYWIRKYGFHKKKVNAQETKIVMQISCTKTMTPFK